MKIFKGGIVVIKRKICLLLSFVVVSSNFVIDYSDSNLTGSTFDCFTNTRSIKKNKFIIDVILPGEGGSKGTISSINVSGFSGTSTKKLDGEIHDVFGNITYVSDSKAYDYEDKSVYDSGWTNQPTVTESYETTEYSTYTFSRFVDIPVNKLHSRKIAAGSKEEFSIETTSSTNVTKTQLSNVGSSYYYDKCTSMSFNVGSSISLDKIGSASAGFGYNNMIKVGGSLYNEISNSTSTSYTYTTVYKQNFIFDNTNEERSIYFELNYRQKFKVYFTTKYTINYDTKEWRSGLFDKDKHWSYSIQGYSGNGTYVYLIPMEDPYFETSKYYDNQNGIRTNVITNPTNNIVYL